MFKTIYHRFRAQKKLQDCYKLLEEGARLQLQEGQLNCGVELALMLVEVRRLTEVVCASHSFNRTLREAAYTVVCRPMSETMQAAAETTCSGFYTS